MEDSPGKRKGAAARVIISSFQEWEKVNQDNAERSL